MSGPNTADQVPAKYDVIIDGYGYITARAVDPNMPFRVQQQMLSYSPTFVERQNVSNSYGDNAQDFFLTIRQRDWSLGEQQRYFRPGNDGRYWMGSGVDISTPGQARLSPSLQSTSFAAAVTACARDTNTMNIVAASATNLYRITPQGVITDLGAHGLGAAPGRWGLCTDGQNNYLSAATGGSVGIRKWNGAAFSTFSATGVDSLAFVNNTLYGYQANNTRLMSIDTGGTSSVLFPWKSADGAVAGIGNSVKLHSFGGKLLVAFVYAQEAAELWIWDGVGASRLEVFPENFIISDIEVLYGVAYVAGAFIKPSGADNVARSAVMFYDGSSIGKLWQANAYSATTMTTSNLGVGPHPALGVNDGRLIFTDETNGNLMAYDPARGGVATIGSFTPNAGNESQMASTGQFVLHTRNQSGAYYFPAAIPSSATVISSLIDFDSSLPKQFRGVKVEFDAGSDGNGGSVDIAYQVDSLTGSWTTLKTGAVSGTEYTFTGISGHAIAIRLTINKGTSTLGPTVTSCSVRGAPSLTSYRINEYILDLGGDANAQNPVVLRDQTTPHPLNGEQMRANLAAAIQATAPVTVTDRTGTFTAMLEPANCEFDLTRPGQWYARIHVREV